MNVIETDLTTSAADLAISQAAEHTGVSAHTLRYYERIGLLKISRGHTGHRVFADADIQRVNFITRLRQTDMPIRDIQRYFALVEQGPATESERLDLLLRHRDAVRAHLETLESALDAVELKIKKYGGAGQPPATTTRRAL